MANKSTDEQYTEYLNNHIANVQKGFKWLIDNKIVSGDKELITTIERFIEEHDASKKSPEEWGAYREYFYADGDETAFNKAWLHHIHNNPHHWQHWVLINDDNNFDSEGKMVAIEMPAVYVIEMICDWWAFSWAKGELTEIFNWYEENKNNMILHEKSRELVEWLLDKIKEKLNG